PDHEISVHVSIPPLRHRTHRHVTRLREDSYPVRLRPLALGARSTLPSRRISSVGAGKRARRARRDRRSKGTSKTTVQATGRAHRPVRPCRHHPTSIANSAHHPTATNANAPTTTTSGCFAPCAMTKTDQNPHTGRTARWAPRAINRRPTEVHSTRLG